MADEVRKSIDPMTDGSGGWVAPPLGMGMRFRDFGSYGLRQFGGWVREEILQDLTGREAARAYREMLDNSPTIGAMMFAIQQAMRRVTWRTEPANDGAGGKKEAEYVDSLRDDMSHSWDAFLVEALSMLGYGYSAHEIVYKRRLGTQPEQPYTSPDVNEIPSSKYNDGRLGWRRLPIRGQDVTLKWFFDANGQTRGLTQQPWIGTLIDIPIEKLLLFRPQIHKNNPEGRSVIRNAYRSYYFVKRLEEMEAILIERMSGFPVMYVPSQLIDTANAPVPANTPISSQQAAAKAAYQAYQNMVTGVRVNDQMGAVLPSDPWTDVEGKISAHRKYEFQLVTPQRGRSSLETDKIIARHKVDMLMTLICDFLMMGHEVRGTNNLSITRVDMFYSAIEGWLNAVAEVINKYGLGRLYDMNGISRDLMPKMIPDMPQRLDLDSLGAFIKNISAAGMPLFPDEELESFIRDAAGMPLFDDMTAAEREEVVDNAANMSGAKGDSDQNIGGTGDTDKRQLPTDKPTYQQIQKARFLLSNPDALRTVIRGVMAKQIKHMRADAP